MGEFANRVFHVVRQIPRGKVSTYGQVARLIGTPRSARYVGYALRANPEPGTDPGSIPCHRVVFKDGRMATGFAFGGEEVQRAMLEEEGVAFDDEGRVRMDDHLWTGIPDGGIRTLEKTITLPCVDGNDRKVDVLSVDEVIALEHRIAEEGTSLYELMHRAGRSLAEVAEEQLKASGRIVVLAGSGNNGGDGWVGAQILADAGYQVTLISKSDPTDLSAEPARTSAIEARESRSFDTIINPGRPQLESLLKAAEVLIDAILGTGFAHDNVRLPYEEWIELANETHNEFSTPIISADCPSGLNAQTGEAASRCIIADTTVTMLAPKCGLLESEALPFVGKLILAPLE